MFTSKLWVAPRLLPRLGEQGTMLTRPIAPQCLHSLPICHWQTVPRARLAVTASACCEDSSQRTEPATQAILLEDRAARASPLRQLAAALTTAAISSRCWNSTQCAQGCTKTFYFSWRGLALQSELSQKHISRDGHNIKSSPERTSVLCLE